MPGYVMSKFFNAVAPRILDFAFIAVTDGGKFNIKRVALFEFRQTIDVRIGSTTHPHHADPQPAVQVLTAHNSWTSQSRSRRRTRDQCFSPRVVSNVHHAIGSPGIRETGSSVSELKCCQSCQASSVKEQAKSFTRNRRTQSIVQRTILTFGPRYLASTVSEVASVFFLGRRSLFVRNFE